MTLDIHDIPTDIMTQYIHHSRQIIDNRIDMMAMTLYIHHSRQIIDDRIDMMVMTQYIHHSHRPTIEAKTNHGTKGSGFNALSITNNTSSY